MNLKDFSFLFPFLKKSIKWKWITKGIYKKAIKYIKESEIYKIEKEEDFLNNFKAYNFFWKPIKGYNKEIRIVRVVLFYDNNGNIKDTAVFCNCDGFKKNKVCSHILALYILLKNIKNEKRRL